VPILFPLIIISTHQRVLLAERQESFCQLKKKLFSYLRDVSVRKYFLQQLLDPMATILLNLI